MTVITIPKAAIVLVPPKELVQSGPEFGCHVTISGESYEFTFSWNRYYGYYALNIMSKGRNTIRKIYPDTGEIYDIKFFNPKDRGAPHALISIQDSTGALTPPMPHNLGVTHSIVVIPYGEVEL